MTEAPAVSVVMCVKDGGIYLEEAVRAVLDQTFENFELIVVDDGSTDYTPETLARLATKDSRLHVLTNPTNQGISAATNRGLDAARGRYIARMDADDIAEPKWLETLFGVLEERPELDFAGTSIYHINDQGQRIGIRRLTHEPAAIRWALTFDLAMSHPTVMFRNTQGCVTASLRYDPALPAAVDFDFFARLSALGAEGQNLRAVLVSYRIHQASISHTRRTVQRQVARQIALRMQKNAFSPGVFEALQDFRDAYYDERPAPPHKILTGLVAARICNLDQLDPGWSAKEVARLFETAMVRSGRRRWHARALTALLAPGLFLYAALQHMKDRRE